MNPHRCRLTASRDRRGGDASHSLGANATLRPSARVLIALVFPEKERTKMKMSNNIPPALVLRAPD